MKKMLRRDRTGEEKRVDAIMKDGFLRLGAEPTSVTQAPTAYPYVLVWDRLGRKGQRCKIISNKPLARTVQIIFADGLITVINRMAIRRFSTTL